MRGCDIAVTAVALMYQWAEMARIAVGVGNDNPSCCHDSVNRFISMVFIGLPCPINVAGTVTVPIP